MLLGDYSFTRNYRKRRIPFDLSENSTQLSQESLQTFPWLNQHYLLEKGQSLYFSQLFSKWKRRLNGFFISHCCQRSEAGALGSAKVKALGNLSNRKCCLLTQTNRFDFL